MSSMAPTCSHSGLGPKNSKVLRTGLFSCSECILVFENNNSQTIVKKEAGDEKELNLTFSIQTVSGENIPI